MGDNFAEVVLVDGHKWLEYQGEVLGGAVEGHVGAGSRFPVVAGTGPEQVKSPGNLSEARAREARALLIITDASTSGGTVVRPRNLATSATVE